MMSDIMGGIHGIGERHERQCKNVSLYIQKMMGNLQGMLGNLSSMMNEKDNIPKLA